MRLLGLALAAVFLLAAGTANSQDPNRLLDAAVDPKTPAYIKRYAYSRLHMLADSSASIFLSAVHSGGTRAAFAARLLKNARFPEAEPALLSAAFGGDPLLADAAAESLGGIYARRSDHELLRMLRRGGREPGGDGDSSLSGGEHRDSPENSGDWLDLTLREARVRSRFRAFVMRGLHDKYAALENAGDPRSMPDALAQKIWEFLGDADPELRLWAIRAAAVSGSDQAPERWASFLYVESDERLLVAGLRAMARLRPPGHGDAVERHASHADPDVALEALAALDALGYGYAMFPSVSGKGRRSVAGFVRHPSTALRLRALEILGETSDPRAEKYVVAALDDLSGPVRILAAKIAGEKRFANAPGALSVLLNDSWPMVRGEAAKALVRLGVVGVVPRALDDLEKGDPEQSRQAARTLGGLGDVRAVRHLLASLGGGDPELAAAALESLGALGDRSAGPGIFDLMRAKAGSDPALADAARDALFHLYGDDPGDSAASHESWAGRNGMEGERR